MLLGILMWILPVLKRNRKAMVIYTMIALCIGGVSNLLIILNGELCFTIATLTDGVSIALRSDELSRFFAVLMLFVWILVGVYSFGYMEHEKHQIRYFGFYIMVMGVLSGLYFSANLVTLYFFYELMTLTTLPLVIHSLKKKAVAAGYKYLLYSVAGALMALMCIFFLFRYTTTLDFVAGGSLDRAALAGNEGVLLAMVFLSIIGFGCKAGMFPLEGWLPTAHPEAPAPASAVLSGIITKSGVIAIIRVVYYSVGADFIRGSWVQYAWMVLALITVFLGSMMAYREPLLKKRLAYSTVSQVSYVLFGLSVMNSVGFMGALMHVYFHSLVKNVLFMCSGSIIHQTGCTTVAELRGIGKRMPVTIWCFTLVSITLIGIPPTSAFLSKWYLASGALSADIGAFSWIGPVILLVSALLTAGYLLPVTVKGFFPGTEAEPKFFEKCETGVEMLVPIVTFTVLAVVLGMFPGPVMDAITRITSVLF